MCCKTDKSRDLIRSLPVRSAFGLPVHIAPSQALHSRLGGVYPERAKRFEWARNDTYAAPETVLGLGVLAEKISVWHLRSRVIKCAPW
jgi:hypothetical protein